MSKNYYKELTKFQKDNGVKADENLLERKLYEAETLTRWQDPTIEDLIKENLELKRKLGEADEAVEYWQIDCDKRSKVLDKIKEKLIEIIVNDTRKPRNSIDIADIREMYQLLEEIE